MRPNLLPKASAATLTVPPKTSTEAPDASTGSAATTPTDKEEFARLAAMRPTEYDRVRKEEAKRLGIQVKTLDDEVKAIRAGDSVVNHLPFDDIEPHSEPVDPAQVLDQVVEIIGRHIVMNKEQADAMALWVAMTWFIDDVEVAPLAIITAPENACGKSQLLTILGYIAARPLSAANSTASFLFRAITTWRPTILIDEAQALSEMYPKWLEMCQKFDEDNKAKEAIFTQQK
jgi:putative DNA primase/helicase